MRLSKQLFASDMRVPLGFSEKRTSSLLEDGIFTYFRNPGLPFYLPIGKKVLRNMQDMFFEEAENLGLDNIDIPTIIKDEVLEKGEAIVDTFNEKIIRLNNENLKGYHLLTTPETLILDLSSISLNTYLQLPIRYIFEVDVSRGIQQPKGLLKGRQFKTLMGTSLDSDTSSLEESLGLFEQLSDNIFKGLDIKVYKRRNHELIDIEHFYIGTEGDNLLLSEVDHENRVKALSLSMAYRYDYGEEISARFRNKQNKNSKLLYGTFGLGTQRSFYALFDSHRDDRGFNLPSRLAPFQYSIIPVSSQDFGNAEEIYKLMHEDTLFDDRKKVSFGEKVKFSDYTGVPWKIINGNGTFTLKNRDETDIKSSSDISEIMERLNHTVS